MLVLAHRGRRTGHDHPDNSVAAIEAALQLGCDGVEIDVRRTFDGEAVLWHDRIGPDGRPIVQLKRHELSAQAGYEVPTLAAVLARFDGAFFDVELKTADALAAATAALVRADPLRLVVTSFRHDLVMACAGKLPVECGIIVSHRPASPSSGPWLPFAANPRMRTIVWEFESLDPPILEHATSGGFRHMTWGSLTATDCRTAASLGLAAVIVDR